jgi:hypothetical protein
MKQKQNVAKIKKPLYKRWWFIGLVVIILIGAFGNRGADSLSAEPPESSTDAQEIVVAYEVVKKEDISIGNVKRYSWEVVVKEPASIDQLKAIASEVIERAKDDKDFNALVVSFYDYAEFIGNGYVLGKVEFAPDGDWAKADTVETGEYDKMEYVYNLKEKDWSKQLNSDEVEIFKSTNELFYSKVTPSFTPDESDIYEEIAKQFNTDKEEVDRIMMKQITWMMDDNQ